jgi:hypothetical protein
MFRIPRPKKDCPWTPADPAFGWIFVLFVVLGILGQVDLLGYVVKPLCEAWARLVEPPKPVQPAVERWEFFEPPPGKKPYGPADDWKE